MQFESLAEKRDVLLDAYRKLTDRSRLMVQLASIAYEPTSRTTLMACFSRLKQRDNRDSVFSSKTFNEQVLDPLVKKGLLETGMQGIHCAYEMQEIAARDAVLRGTFNNIVEAVYHYIPVTTRYSGGIRYFNNERRFMREVRIIVHRQDSIEEFHKIFREYHAYGSAVQNSIFTPNNVLVNLANNPFDEDWLRSLSPEWFEMALTAVLEESLQSFCPDEGVMERSIELLREEYEEAWKDKQLDLYVRLMMTRGELSQIQPVLQHYEVAPELRGYPIQGAIDFLEGRFKESIAQYRACLTILRKLEGKRKVFFHDELGIFFIFALLQEGSHESLKEAAELCNIAKKQKDETADVYVIFDSFVQFKQGALHQKTALFMTSVGDGLTNWENLVAALCMYWADVDMARKRITPSLIGFFNAARQSGFMWFAMETAELLTNIDESFNWEEVAELLREGTSYQPIAPILHAQEAWELSLSALANLNMPLISKTESKSQTTRMTWMLSGSGLYQIQPREQSKNAKGGWNKGRNVALKRLNDHLNEFTYLTHQDREVCKYLDSEQPRGYYYGKVEYFFTQKAFIALIGHPHVYWESNPGVAVEVVKGSPELRVIEKKGGQYLVLQFEPKLSPNQDVVLIKETPTRIRVLEVTPSHRRIAELLGAANKLEVPASAKDQVLAAIGAVSSMVTVHSDIGGDFANAEEVEPLMTPYVHLLPFGEGLRMTILMAPFGPEGTYYRPGTGGENVIAEVDGKRLQTTRKLKEEKKLAKAVIEECPSLLGWEESSGEWEVEEPEGSLELLLELHNLGDRIVIEWPQGEKIRIKNSVGLKDFHIKLKSQNEWFNMSGELRLPDGSVMEMQALLKLLDSSTGRFVALGEGQFLALTQEFRRRLQELRDYSDSTAKGVRFNKLTAAAMEDWWNEIGSFEADKAWKEQIETIKSLRDYQPELPSTLQAELRDYQLEGFHWMARLAKWGVGACLADDMGLGKTLQTLAVMLMRAADGPMLAIAPTSVCMNWLSEAQRFAPTLNPIQFGAGNRKEMLDNLKPFDLLVCSYGLLQQEEVAEMLAEVDWKLIVLDEAQSIKNFATKRSQAAMNLKGDFKLLTTGTPIENHLGELWNLFRFINPGLLGSLDGFNQKYGNAIERGQDKQARDRLRKLIQPFILRRTKNQVLQELPSRTEITLQVELSQQEMVFYEALRREAIAKLEESDAQAGAKHLQVLAEIMRLRRACCNTQLVKSEIAIPSSKLQMFGNILTELLENKHKALVFSQFVDHLSFIRAYLDEHNIKYQYLDGSTPAKERKKRVDAFQNGDGDVFLISLKAGGTGLNLTAADYVIHMDPWWNPAVEDQASDRAHRMGQKRPVTIYRLVAQNTIEEKIVQLHHQKRDLADSLLEGTELSSKLNTDDLIQMIHER